MQLGIFCHIPRRYIRLGMLFNSLYHNVLC